MRLNTHLSLGDETKEKKMCARGGHGTIRAFREPHFTAGYKTLWRLQAVVLGQQEHAERFQRAEGKRHRGAVEPALSQERPSWPWTAK